jgi:ketosteroid isomerase-like protein
VDDPVRWGTLVTESLVWELPNGSSSSHPALAVAEVRAEAIIRPTGRGCEQEYVVILRAWNGKIAFLREYFDPVCAARAMGDKIDI